MSVGQNSADAENRTTVSRLDCWSEQSGRVYLSHDEIHRLADGGTHCLIVTLPDEYRRFGDADEAVIIDAPAVQPRRPRTGTLHAIAAGTCIGASTGISAATTLTIMTHKAPVSVVAFIERAITLFV